MEAGGYAGGSRSQLPSWARGGLTGRLAAVRGILYRDSPLQATRRGRREAKEKMEENVGFLRQQHKETLQQLHSEAERLQRENRELSFRLIMCQCGHKRAAPDSSGQSREKAEASAEQQLSALGLQVQQLQQALAEERLKNERMCQLLLQSQSRQTADEEPSKMKDDLRGFLISSKAAPNVDLHTRPGKNQKSYDNFTLPALSQRRSGGGVADRQRRIKALKKKLSLTGLPPLQPT